MRLTQRTYFLTTKHKTMEAIKLTHEQYQRSLKSNKMNHIWLYSTNDTYQRTHNNSIFLNRTVGQPFACLVIEYEGSYDDRDIQKIFGKGIFAGDPVSPDDKENMRWDVYYVKNLVK